VREIAKDYARSRVASSTNSHPTDERASGQTTDSTESLSLSEFIDAVEEAEADAEEQHVPRAKNPTMKISKMDPSEFAELAKQINNPLSRMVEIALGGRLELLEGYRNEDYSVFGILSLDKTAWLKRWGFTISAENRQGKFEPVDVDVGLRTRAAAQEKLISNMKDVCRTQSTGERTGGLCMPWYKRKEDANPCGYPGACVFLDDSAAHSGIESATYSETTRTVIPG